MLMDRKTSDNIGLFDLDGSLANYDKAVGYWRGGKELKSTRYHWRSFEDRQQGTQFRDGYGSLTGNEDESDARGPSPQHYRGLPKEDVNWNRS